MAIGKVKLGFTSPVPAPHDFPPPPLITPTHTPYLQVLQICKTNMLDTSMNGIHKTEGIFVFLRTGVLRSARRVVGSVHAEFYHCCFTSTVNI